MKYMHVFSNKTIKAASWYTISNFMSKALLYLMTPIYTRALSINEYGLYNNFLSWQSILIVALTFNLYSTVNNAYIDYKEKYFDDYISSIAFFSIVVPLIACAVIILKLDYFSKVLNLPNEYVLLLCISIVFSGALNIFQTEQRVKVKYEVSSVLTLGTAVGSVIVTGILLFIMVDKLSAVVLGAVLVTIFMNVIIYIKIFYRSQKIKLSHIKYAVFLALPLLPAILSGTIIGASDKIMIMKFCGPRETALYSLVFVISMVVTMLASSLNQAWVPWFYTKMLVKNYDEIKKATKVYAIVVISGALFSSIIAPEILQIIGGKTYMVAVYLIPPIILKCIVIFIYTLYVNIEFFLKRTGVISIISILVTMITVVLNFYSIQYYGYEAAAYVALITSIIELLMHVYCVNKLGMLDVFDNVFLFKVCVGAFLGCCIILFSYQRDYIRYGFLLVLIISGFIKNYRVLCK